MKSFYYLFRYFRCKQRCHDYYLLLQKEITFAEECRKFITAPKDEWY